MNKKKFMTAIAMSLLCVLMNIAAKALTSALDFPMMFDTIGTMLCAYIYGPVHGAVVGLATNIAYNAAAPIYSIYGLVNAAAGVIVGLFAKKRYLESKFGVLTTTMVVTVVSALISTPLNIIFFDGEVNNKWANGVVELFKTRNFNEYFAYFAGEFYLDFVDKLCTIAVLVAAIRIYRRYASDRVRKAVKELLSISMALVLCVSVMPLRGIASAESVVHTALYSNAADDSDSTDGSDGSNEPTDSDSTDDSDDTDDQSVQIGLSAGVTFDKNIGTRLRTIYDSENGLPGGMVNDIAQTKDGVLWIGTYGGLYRYNGSTFRLMNEFETVKAVNCFLVDEEGRLWIGTNDSGVSICVNDEISTVLNAGSGLPSDSVRAIAQGKDGLYYVGTSDALAIVNIFNGLSITEIVNEITYAKSISVGENYTAVVSDSGILYLLDGAKIIEQSPEESIYSCCFFDEGDILYVGRSDGVIDIFDVSAGSLIKIEERDCGELDTINSINYGLTTEFIICSDNGVGYFTESGEYFDINMGQFSSCVNHVIIDYQENLWFTSSRLGLMKMCTSPFNEIYTVLNMESNVVNAVCEWNGALYFGTDDGIDAADLALENVVNNTITETVENYRVRCLMPDSEGNLWICTSRSGVFRVDEDMNFRLYTKEDGLISNKTICTIETSNGDILVATDTGITCIRDGEAAYSLGEEDGFSTPKIICLLEASNGDILAGTDGSGISIIRNEEIVDTINKSDGLSSNTIMRITADSDGSGYFIVTGNSLSYMDKNYNIRTLTNFPYFNNYDVVDNNDGMLFVLSSAGIYAIDKDILLNGGSECILLDYSRGLRTSLTANSWNYIDDDGTLYLSGDTGVVSFNLDNYTLAPGFYRINLSHIEVDGENIYSQDGETFTIPRGALRVVVDPDIPNYSLTDPYVRMYLEGFENEMTVTTLSTMTHKVYTNLPTGTYRFHLELLNEKGEVSMENIFTIVKEEEIYDKWWFMAYFWIVFVAIIVYIAWLVFRLNNQRTLNLQKREIELAHKQIEMGNQAIMTIARTVDAKDINTSEHSFRVSQYSVMIAKKIGFDEQQCEELRQTALLHDIGKIGIPDSVLNKPGKLTDEEYAIMKTHVVKGAEILENFTFVKNIVEGAKYHHERYDGHGYMEGLKGEEIPLNARIIGIADAFDAMTANRVYRKQLDIDFVIGELRRCRGTQFDPTLTDILLTLIDDGTIDIEKLYADSKASPKRRETQ